MVGRAGRQKVFSAMFDRVGTSYDKGIRAAGGRASSVSDVLLGSNFNDQNRMRPGVPPIPAAVRGRGREDANRKTPSRGRHTWMAFSGEYYKVCDSGMPIWECHVRNAGEAAQIPVPVTSRAGHGTIPQSFCKSVDRGDTGSN